MAGLAGLMAGYGQAQAQHNSKMLDFLNQKSQTMATLYGHLAENAEDPDTAEEFSRRAFGWAQDNPTLDPKGHQQLIKNEKISVHDVIDQAHQRKIAEYHQQTFGGQDTGNQATPIPQPQIQTPQAPQPQPQSLGMSQGPQYGPQRVPESPEDYSSYNTSPAPVQVPPQSEIPLQPPQGVGGPPPTQQVQAPAQPQPAQAPMTMRQYIENLIGPRPSEGGPLGKRSGSQKMWDDAYLKRSESLVPTPAGMQQFMGSPYMPASMASPYSALMGHQLMADSRARATGYKLDRSTGQFVPLNPEEESTFQHAKQAQMEAQAILSTASIPLRQAMTQLATAKTAMIPAQIKAMLSMIGYRVMIGESLSLRAHAMVDGINPQTGKPFVGALAMDDGSGNMSPVGTLFYRGVMPTSASQGKAEMAVPVMESSQALAKFAQDPANSDLFGKYSGNLAAFIARKTGTNDPRETLLRSNLQSLASLMVPLHGFRSQKAAEEFLGTLAQGNSPEAFVQAVMGYNATGQYLYNNAMPRLFDSAGGTRPRMANPNLATPNNPPPASPRFAVGQTFSKGNKKYKVTKVNPDGGVDAVEVP